MQYKIYCPSLVSTAVPVPNIDGCTVCRALASHIQRSVALRADQAIVTVALRQDRPQLVRAAIPVPNIDDAAVRGVLAGIVRKVELTVLRFVIVPKRCRARRPGCGGNKLSLARTAIGDPAQ